MARAIASGKFGAGAGGGGSPAPALLDTKFHLPSVGPYRVERARLAARLDGLTRRRLTLVAAPAGFGKTTLLGDWLHGGGAAAAWLALDEADNDPARFWAYALAALARGWPDGAGTPPAPDPEGAGPQEIGAAIVALLNRAVALPRRLLLVLDDYHLIGNAAIHEAVAGLIDRLPPSLGVVIATRADPPLPLSRWRARGELAELRAAELRFTPAEARAFLIDAAGLPLTPGQSDALEERTEGWIAGLHLAALSLQERAGGDLAPFISAFAGSHRFILDYLIDEVLAQQPPETQEFLLRTAILDRLCGPLCDALTGRQDGQATIEAVERRNLFLVPLDEERAWYRYHHLFADVLRARLRATAPALPPALHRLAGEWHARHGLPGEAIGHLLAAGAADEAAALIERAGWEALARGRIVTLRGWIAALPAATVRARPTLSLQHAWALLHAGQHEGVGRCLRDIEAVVGATGPGAASPDAPAILDEVVLLRAISAYASGSVAPPQAERALRPPADAPARSHGMAALMLGLLHTRGGDMTLADRALSQADAIGSAVGDLGVTVQALGGLARLRALRGQPHEAAALYRRALALAIDDAGQPLPIGAQAHLGLAALLYEWHDLAGADEHSAAGLALADAGAAAIRFFGHKVRARVLHARGDRTGAHAQLRDAEGYCEKAEDRAEVAALRARFLLKEGDLAAAAAWAEGTGLTPEGVEADEADPPPYHPHEFVRLVLVRVLAATGRHAAALRIAASLLRQAERDERSRSVVGILIVQAATLVADGRVAEGAGAIGRALALAEPGGQVYLFLNEGPPVATALRAWLAGRARPAAGDDRLGDYARSLLAAFPAAGTPPAPGVANAALPEPLTAREVELLRLLAAGHSNRLLADDLFVTVGTIKKHLNNIFGKLGATNRTEAVARARALGLLAE